MIASTAEQTFDFVREILDLCKDGRPRWLRISTSASAASDAQTHVFTLVDDITRERTLCGERKLLRALGMAQESERRRIALELHDQLGQQLASLALELSYFTETPPKGAPAAQNLHRLRRLTAGLMDRIHTLVYELHPPELEHLGLKAALRRLVADWSRQGRLSATFQAPRWGGVRLDSAAEKMFYRVAQESLANVRLHARATRVHVLLQRRLREVLLVIEDNGRGFDYDSLLEQEDARQCLGLLGMKERMAAAGGSLGIETAPGAGTTIFARAPIASAT